MSTAVVTVQALLRSAQRRKTQLLTQPHPSPRDAAPPDTTPEYLLSVLKSGDGMGDVESDPLGIDCGEDCEALFLAGTPVQLTATPTGGATFGGWSGSCGGLSTTCMVTKSLPPRTDT